MYGVSRATIRKWITKHGWTELKDAAKATNLFLIQSSQAEILKGTADQLGKLIFLMAAEGGKSLEETGQLPARFPIKTLTDAVDKLERLRLHVASGGVSKTASINVNLTESIIQDVILEVAIELERRIPSLNSRDMVKELFNKHLKKIMDKIR